MEGDQRKPLAGGELPCLLLEPAKLRHSAQGFGHASQVAQPGSLRAAWSSAYALITIYLQTVLLLLCFCLAQEGQGCGDIFAWQGVSQSRSRSGVRRPAVAWRRADCNKSYMVCSTPNDLEVCGTSGRHPGESGHKWSHCERQDHMSLARRFGVWRVGMTALRPKTSAAVHVYLGRYIGRLQPESKDQ